MKFSLFALVVSVLVHSALSGSLDSCGLQKDCLKYTFSKIAENEHGSCDGECSWQVCVELDLTNPTCTKSPSDTVSHTCVKGEYCAGQNGFSDATEVQEINTGYKQCQTGKAGTIVEFLFKDGKTCEPGSYDALFSTMDGMAYGSCYPSTSDIESCTGVGNVGKECIWEILLPECYLPPPPPPPSGGCPSGNGICYTPDCRCIAGNCDIVSDDSLANALYNYTGNDGTYTIKSQCSDGKYLSNAIKGTDPCKKIEINETANILFEITVKNGQPTTPFSLKCGTTCYVYGQDDFLVCNQGVDNRVMLLGNNQDKSDPKIGDPSSASGFQNLISLLLLNSLF